MTSGWNNPIIRNVESPTRSPVKFIVYAVYQAIITLIYKFAGMKKRQAYSLSEEILNFTTHGFGVLMGLAVCIFFIIKGSAIDSPFAVRFWISSLLASCLCAYGPYHPDRFQAVL